MLADRLARIRDRLARAAQSPSDRKAVLFVVAIAAGFLLLTTLLHLPHGPEHWSADYRTARWSKHPDTQHKRIALVYVTEKTLEVLPVSFADRPATAGRRGQGRGCDRTDGHRFRFHHRSPNGACQGHGADGRLARCQGGGGGGRRQRGRACARRGTFLPGRLSGEGQPLGRPPALRRRASLEGHHRRQRHTADGQAQCLQGLPGVIRRAALAEGRLLSKAEVGIHLLAARTNRQYGDLPQPVGRAGARQERGSGPADQGHAERTGSC